MADFLSSQPPPCSFYKVEFPTRHVLLVTINRATAMNAIPTLGHLEGIKLWNWYDEEPDLRVAIVTGQGKTAFCAGADLKEQNQAKAGGGSSLGLPRAGFMGMSQRVGKKPLIAAVNGFALGGGFEIALNCDIVVASPNAVFGLPEASRGLYAAAGGLSRAVRTFGMQLASEIVLAGRKLSAVEAEQRGFCRVAQSSDSLLGEALTLARSVADLSPDAVIVSRHGLRQAWETSSVDRAAQLTDERYGEALMGGDNLKIGLQAFVDKKKPKWISSKL